MISSTYVAVKLSFQLQNNIASFKMLKVILLALVAAATAKDLDLRRYTHHIPPWINADLDLSTGELKVFSGHAMNLIRSKCPAVDSGKIFQLQKYISKLIAKVNPVPGKSQEFKKLLETMTTCAKEEVVPVSKPEGRRIFESILAPYNHKRTFWIQKSTPTIIPAIQPISDEETRVDAGFVKEAPIWKSIEHEGPAEIPTEPTHRIIKTTIFVRPEQAQEGIRTNGGVFSWIRNIFSRVGDFFNEMLPFHMIRKKRDVSDAPIEPETTIVEEPSNIDSVDAPIDANPEAETFHVKPMRPFIFDTVTKIENSGKQAFGKLIDNLCRIYCDACTGPKEIINFKKSAIQLLEFLFVEDSGIEITAKKFLDEEFLESINNCQN